MIKLFPKNNLQSLSPCCGHQVEPNSDYLFLGIHFLVKSFCGKCGQGYFCTLPVGHTLRYPICITEDGHVFNRIKIPDWLVDPFLMAFKEQNQSKLSIIKKKTHNETGRVILLNCLDYCYGHVFWKLLNAERHLRQAGFGLVVIIPASFIWLVPEAVEEVWVVEGPIKQFKKGIQNLDGFIKEQIERFDEVYLSRAYVHLDHTEINIENFVKTKKFDLNVFDQAKPIITFVMREDRFWIKNRIDELFYKLCIKFRLLSKFKLYFVRRQNGLIRKTARALKKQLPDCLMFATGLGNSGKLSKIITDNRVDVIDLQVEKAWCEIYAQSHIVFGVHGSNMIIPTSLAAGFIEILPDYKIPNLSEDILISSETRYTLFLGRHLSSFSKPALVVKHMVNMIKLFHQVKDNMNPTG